MIFDRQLCDGGRMLARRLLVSGVVVAAIVSALASQAKAQNADRKYNAFDLASDFLVAENNNANSAVLVQGGSVLACGVGRAPPTGHPPPPAEARLTVAHNKDCPLFTQSTPSKFTALLTLGGTCAAGAAGGGPRPDCPASITYDFAPGIDVRGNYDGTTYTLPNEWNVAAGNLKGCVATLGDGGWEQSTMSIVATVGHLKMKNDVAPGATPPRHPRQGALFLRSGDCDTPSLGKPILRLTYTFAQDPLQEFPLKRDRSVYCKKHVAAYTASCSSERDGAYPNANVTWVLYVDQTRDTGPRIVYAPDNYIRVNSFGRVRVRHFKHVNPTLLPTGAGAALTAPSESGGLSSDKASGGIGASFLASDNGEAVISEFLVAPRAPGALNIAVKFTDAADPGKARGEVGAEMLVDKAYSGAFRFGLSRVLGLSEIQYVGVQKEKDGPFIVTKNASPPHEVVLGLSLYSQYFGQGGRTYFLRKKYSGWWKIPKCLWSIPQWLWRHGGLYVGVGALSYSSANVDIMKSLHLGVEFELLPNLSIALTTAIRRTPVLGDGIFEKGEVPSASVYTTNTYRAGIGLVLNVSADFLKFATKGGQ
ncbi:MAG: hypothetical protein KF773_24830 [Deltaproteobacteria bacterium]|nr:hypothetical protein [Deltaproteobacteria bacterium]